MAAPTITITVGFDGQAVDVKVPTDKTVGDIIKTALKAFKVDEDHEDCHLAGPDRLYFPQEDLSAWDTLDIGNGVMFNLMVPF